MSYLSRKHREEQALFKQELRTRPKTSEEDE